MTAKTPEDRLRTVEKHTYDIQAIAEALECASQLAHLTNQSGLGFMIGIMAKALQTEADAVLAAAATKAGGQE
ncbi:hypothetical protein TSH100_04255 [Azospirillum sp. TSH100]|uniref:hypothetical protein n=1 Tax=Azospirillum sp. TSH100 TaxID=652764 RepID=UPI000D6116D8|nr:hypothetical protein [Azospirillum sp. TSH100]PWC89853.1 hypothetical protein TSH100_04255 [Azospirillum sp. TSH100]QCG92335.1 hypothetical protein E6C72_31510 [Azospirillum sp. TSH100]